ncbi:exonuclease domain-containing protein [Flagellimonas meridianipacifica]|uniref:Excinuclease cho n=1 Tax=Flagellimonas meridianipacifica TaxID=1080225 RepID=A0A2T0M8E5_9FLAO|nr:exonuclease domain-containing protein [Allomuricauda pacifica]PRX53774.1 DNA polymerase-3 subunit epsilon [Allomuricauda pacifica]
MYTIIDIETTGNGIKGNRITEIAIFKHDGQKIIDEFTSLVNPQCPIPYFITGLTGIDNQMVANAPLFSDIADTVLNLTQDSIFVAHSVNFDYGVVKEEFRQLGVAFVRKKLCTVRLSRKLIPGLRSYSLGKLCSSVNIPLSDRHRARGDAHATVLLFEKLLQTPTSQTVFQTFLHARSQEATLPPHLDKSEIDAIPQKPGIYYFKDRNGTIIYVGKAINLKKRVLGHFYDKSEKEIRLCRETAHIDFELSGSELVALLMESAEIKKHFPLYNRAQKRNIKQFGIFCYEDRKGIKHLAFNTLKHIQQPIKVFYNLTDCRLFLKQICSTYQLCPKFCHLQLTESNCSFYESTSCEGICSGKEQIDGYNEKVDKAIADLAKEKAGVKILKEKGRHVNENAFVLVDDGQYRGYGFIEDTLEINSKTDIEAFLIPQKNTLETQRIVESRMSKIKCLEL